MSNSFPEIKRICIFGVGGVGGYFGGKIAKVINDQQSKGVRNLFYCQRRTPESY